MNILLTNDDGYNAIGINLLKDKLEKYGTVVVVAPSEEQSAKSVAITVKQPIFVKKIKDNVFACSGTPADCVAFGLTNLSAKFDLVVAGCNNGLNVSYDTIFSGTVGACMQGLIERVPGIAVSCNGNFEVVDRYFDLMMSFINKYKILSTEYLLNVNFPTSDIVRGISIGSLYYRKDHYYFNQNDGAYYAHRDLQTDFSDDVNSDCYQVNNGVISVVPIGKTGYNPTFLEFLKQKIHETK